MRLRSRRLVFALMLGVAAGCSFDVGGMARSPLDARAEGAAGDAAVDRPADAGSGDRMADAPVDAAWLDGPASDGPGSDGPDDGSAPPTDAGGDAAATPVALSFDGWAEATVPDSASLDITASALTMEAWVYVTGPDDWVHMAVVGRQIMDDRGWTMWHGLAGYSNGAEWTFGLVVADHYYAAIAATSLPRESWVHLAGTYDGTALRVFIDGVLAGEDAGPFVTGTALSTNDDEWTVGATPDGDALEGRLDEIRISAAVRYAGDFAPPTAPFAPDSSTRALWHLDEGAGEVSADASGNGNDLVLSGTSWTAGRF